jgi:hypothetical protein
MPRWIATLLALLPLWIAGCGPGVGGTGTGAAAFEAFGAAAASVCDGALAAALNCPPASPSAPTAGPQTSYFADAAGKVALEVQDNRAVLVAACERLQFSGEFGVAGTGGVQGFFGIVRDDASGAEVLAALAAVAVPGTNALTIELRDLNDRVLLGPVLVLRVGSAITPGC